MNLRLFPNVESMALALCAAMILCSPLSGPAHAQAMTQEQIDQMATMMRAQGQSEAQVEKFIEQMKGVQKFSQDLEANQSKGMSEEQAARKAAGFSDQEIADMDKMDAKIAALEKQGADLALERDRREFNAEHGNKPDAKVTLGSKSYSLKLIKCDIRGELFQVYAEGPPGPERLSLNAGRSSAYGQGGYFEGVNFRAGDLDAGVGQKTGEWVGKKFTFDDQLTVHNIRNGTKSEDRLVVDLTCP